MKKKKVYLKKTTIATLKLCLGLLLLVASVFLLVVSINYDESAPVALKYQENKKLDYQVYLKDNDYFSVSYLPQGGYYIRSLIDHIHVDYEYKIDADKLFDTKYQYRVVAELVLRTQQKEESAHELWNKQYVITPTRELNTKDVKGFDVVDSFDIPYQEYESIVDEFNENYLEVTKPILKVEVYITGTGYEKESKEAFTLEPTMKLNIPLYGDTISIDATENSNDEVSVYRDTKGKWLKNDGLFIIGCLTFLASCVVVASYLSELIHHHSRQASYEKRKRKILNKYDDVIVNARKLPDLKEVEVIEVSDFHELLDARRTLKVPIIFIEIAPGVCGWFVLIYEDQVWRYRLEGESRK